MYFVSVENCMLDVSLKTRFCPSPTGLIHLGNARTALFNYLLAHRRLGEFLLRIEDTDPERSKVVYEDALYENLRWLGLLWDEGPQADGGHGPYHQSKRDAVYQDYYERLQAAGVAYPCFCSPEQLALTRKMQRASGQPPRYPGTCRGLSPEAVLRKKAEGVKPTLRFCVPTDQVIRFTDLVRGEQCFATKDIGDFIIRRADGSAPFMFCNAIDDALMGVTHALRGEDHLTNTPRQMMILDTLGLTVPTYGHISLIVGSDGSPLSKRHGSRSIRELEAEGYLPGAVVNYLARLGHYYQNEAWMSLSELAAAFQIEGLNKSSARFNLQQLRYWQKEAVARLDREDFWAWLGQRAKARVPVEQQDLFAETVQPNILFPSDALLWLSVCYGESDLGLDEAHKMILNDTPAHYFEVALEAYHQHHPNYANVIQHLKTNTGLKGRALFQPLRVALTGQTQGPELDKLLQLIQPHLIERRLQEVTV
jgi:glutamyl-tRNA synthetase